MNLADIISRKPNDRKLHYIYVHNTSIYLLNDVYKYIDAT